MGLEIRDLLNLAQYFPTMMIGGEPAWAISGGGVIFSLLHADMLVGATRLPNDLPEDRNHKDLDVYAFYPTGNKLRNVLPHEIYRTAFYSKPKRCNYRNRAPNYSGFFIEILQDSFFGYEPPSCTETVFLQMGGKSFWALCPEYMIATRRFHALPERREDVLDIKLITKAFELNPARLHSIIGRGPLGFLLKDPTFDGDAVRALVYEDDGGERVRGFAVAEALRRFPFLADYKLDDHALSCFLFLDQSMLSWKAFERMMCLAQDVMKGIHSIGQNKLSMDSLIAVALTIGAGFPRGKSISANSVELLRHSDWFHADREMGLRASIQLYAGLCHLQSSKMISNATLNSLRAKIVNEFCQTKYMNVLLSALYSLPNVLCRQRSQSELLAAFEPFGNLIGIRSTGKRFVEIAEVCDSEEESV